MQQHTETSPFCKCRGRITLIISQALSDRSRLLPVAILQQDAGLDCTDLQVSIAMGCRFRLQFATAPTNSMVFALVIQ